MINNCWTLKSILSKKAKTLTIEKFFIDLNTGLI